MLTLEQIAAHTARAWWGRANLPHPRLGPLYWRKAAELILFEFGADPLSSPDEIANAEGFEFVVGFGLGTCGCVVNDLVVLQNAKSKEGMRLSFHHERAHVHARRGLIDGGNEADIWATTLELAFPRSIPRATLERLYGLGPNARNKPVRRAW